MNILSFSRTFALVSEQKEMCLMIVILQQNVALPWRMLCFGFHNPQLHWEYVGCNKALIFKKDLVCVCGRVCVGEKESMQAFH